MKKEEVPRWPVPIARGQLWKRDGKLVRVEQTRASNVLVTDLKSGRSREIPREAFEREWRFERGPTSHTA